MSKEWIKRHWTPDILISSLPVRIPMKSTEKISGVIEGKAIDVEEENDQVTKTNSRTSIKIVDSTINNE